MPTKAKIQSIAISLLAAMTVTACSISIESDTLGNNADPSQKSHERLALHHPATKLHEDENGWSSRREIKTYYDYQLIYTHGGDRTPKSTSLEETVGILSKYDVIFIGEAHKHPGNHLAQMQIFKNLHNISPNLSLSLEQFETDTQPLLDRYMAGEIGTWPLMSLGRAWDNFPSSYRPLISFARDHNLPVIAAEAPTDIVTCVGKKGLEYLDRLPDDVRGFVAKDIHLQIGSDYFNKFIKFASSNSSHGKSKNKKATHAPIKKISKKADDSFKRMMNSYAGQVVRDDTMAERISTHLTQYPERKIVHLNGSFHSDSFMGTAERLALRNPDLKIAVISPIQVKDKHQPTFTSQESTQGTFLLLIHPVDPEVKDPDMKKEWLKAIMKVRSKRTCQY